MPGPADPPFDVRLMNWIANALFALLFALALGNVALWAARHPGWTLGRIVVDGEVAHQDEVTIRARLQPWLKGSYLALDLQEVRQLAEQLPWVSQAVVRREFPNRLRLTLKEQQAVAWWGEAGGGKLVNPQGAVFEASSDDPQADSWPELAGPEGQSAAVLAQYRQLQPVFAPLQQQIERLELGPSGGWKAWLDGGTVVELGRGEPDELLARARRFSTTVTQLLDRYDGRAIEAVDLRYPSGYAVRMRGVRTVSDDRAAQAARNNRN